MHAVAVSATEAMGLAQSLGVLIAVYVFVVDLLRRRLDEMEELKKGEGWEDIPGPMVEEAQAAERRASDLLRIAWGFAVAPILIALIYSPVIVDIITGVDWDRPYEPAKATLVLLEVSLLALGAWQISQARAMGRLRSWYRERKQWSIKALDDERASVKAAAERRSEGGEPTNLRSADESSGD